MEHSRTFRIHLLLLQKIQKQQNRRIDKQKSKRFFMYLHYIEDHRGKSLTLKLLISDWPHENSKTVKNMETDYRSIMNQSKHKEKETFFNFNISHSQRKKNNISMFQFSFHA